MYDFQDKKNGGLLESIIKSNGKRKINPKSIEIVLTRLYFYGFDSSLSHFKIYK
jgi:hypothetical protein